MIAAKSLARAVKARALILGDAIQINAFVARQMRANKPAAPRTVTRRKVCTLKA
jgi:hypothetical protein